MKRRNCLALTMMGLATLMLISCTQGYESASSSSIDAEDEWSSEEHHQPRLEVDLTGFTANIGTAKSIGIGTISNSKESGSSKVLRSSKKTVLKEKSEEKKYIVSSNDSTEYEANDPEVDENGLTKVTFTKIVTENVTTETKGTKYLTARNGSISIAATTNFKYTVSYDDSIIYSEVTDNDSNDKDSNEGFILLDGLTDGLVYKVEYHGIGEEVTVTQDEIVGEIDKLYVINGFTFIRYLPEGASRPNDSELEYDIDGISTYDKCDYFSASWCVSFVIDNASGYIYKLDKFNVDKIEKGLFISNDKYYDMSVSGDAELVFAKVVKNETFKIYDIFKDKYGNKYVMNDSIDTYDSKNKTVYYTEEATNYYLLSLDGTAVHIDLYDHINERSNTRNIRGIEKMNLDFSGKEISEDETYYFYRSPRTNGPKMCGAYYSDHFNCGYDINNNVIHNGVPFIENGYFYCSTCTADFFYRMNLTSKEWKFWTSCGSKVYIEYPFNEHIVFFSPSRDKVLFYYSLTKKIYCTDVFGDNAFILPDNISIDDDFFVKFLTENDDKLSVILEDCERSNRPLYDGFEWFMKVTLDGTEYYKVILDEDGEPKAVNPETYVAPEPETIVLQPLNK